MANRMKDNGKLGNYNVKERTKVRMKFWAFPTHPTTHSTSIFFKNYVQYEISADFVCGKSHVRSVFIHFPKRHFIFGINQSFFSIHYIIAHFFGIKFVFAMAQRGRNTT
jgi:hypothetical protein